MKAFFIQILNDDMKTLGLTGKFETVNWPEQLSYSQNNTYECLDKNISMNSGSMVHDESHGPIFDSLVYFDTIDTYLHGVSAWMEYSYIKIVSYDGWGWEIYRVYEK